MITLQEFCDYLEGVLDSSSFEDYCYNGVQVESGGSIARIAMAVSASMSSIEKAVSADVDALIVHHGMFWNRDSSNITGVKSHKLKMLLENGISLIAYHLPLDAHEEFGNNWKAARDLGWQNLEPFGEFNGKKIGVKGTFDCIKREDMARRLETYYGHVANAAYGGKDVVESAALISGGAHMNIIDAGKEGIDCFITGSFDEPVWHIAHEEKINFLAMGHSATERVGVSALGNHLAKHFNVECSFIESSNPF